MLKLFSKRPKNPDGFYHHWVFGCHQNFWQSRLDINIQYIHIIFTSQKHPCLYFTGLRNIIDYSLSILHYPFSIVNYQLSITKYQLL